MGKKTSRESYRRASDIASCLVAMYDRWISVPSFRKEYDATCFIDAQPGEIDGEKRAIMFMIDLCKCNRNLGYTVTSLDNASMPAYYALQHLLIKDKCYDYETFRLCAENERMTRETVRMFAMFDKEADRAPTIIGFFEILNRIDHKEAQKYIEILKHYTRYVGQEAALETGVVEHWLRQLEIMSVGIEKALETPINIGSVDEIKSAGRDFGAAAKPEKDGKKKLSGFSKGFIIADVLTTGIVIGFFCLCELPGFGCIVGGGWFIVWLICILAQEYGWDLGSSSYDPYESSSYGSDESDSPDYDGGSLWKAEDFDMTKDYYGKHGEFDSNDESRRISEDIQQMHNCSPDADLTDHYYWDDVLDAETDGYLDDSTD